VASEEYLQSKNSVETIDDLRQTEDQGGDQAKSFTRMVYEKENLGNSCAKRLAISICPRSKEDKKVSHAVTGFANDDDSVVEIVGVSSSPLPDLPLSRSLLAIGEEMAKSDCGYRQKPSKKSRVPLDVVFIDAGKDFTQSMNASSKHIRTCSKHEKSTGDSTQSSGASRSSKRSFQKSSILPPKDSTVAREVSETKSSSIKTETMLLSSSLNAQSSHVRIDRDKGSAPCQSTYLQLNGKAKRQRVRALRKKPMNLANDK
jgi:hypothetical protein